MSRQARPYLVADPQAVSFPGWTLASGDTPGPLPETLPDWDYNTDLVVGSVLDLDRSRIEQDTGVAASAPLRVVVSWRSVDGRIGTTAHIADLGDASHLRLDVVLPGADLGPEIDLWVRLVLGKDIDGAGPGVAHLAGSILWEHSMHLVLAGDASRFPISVVDFAAYGLDPDAGWALQAPASLDAPVLGEFALLLNAGDTSLVTSLTGPTTQELAVQAMFEQVTVRLLEIAVERVDELDEASWEPGTFGAVLAALTDRVAGGVRALATLRVQHPTRYRTVLAGEARRNGSRGAL